MAHEFGVVNAGSASPMDFVVPNLLHPVWGNALRRLFPSQDKLWVERSLYLSVVSLFLAGIAAWKKRDRTVVPAYAVVGAVTAVLALGPILRWGGQDVTVAVPESLRTWLGQVGIWSRLLRSLGTVDDRLIIPLPAQVLRRLLPVARSIRVWARFGILTTLAVSVLAGIGLDVLLSRIGTGWSRRSTNLIGGGILGLLLLDLLAVPPLWPISVPYMSRVKPRAVDLWLRGQEPGALVQFPISLQGTHQYYAITHRKPIVMGYGTFVPAHFRAAEPALEAFPAEESLEVLRDWQVRYVLIDSDAYGSSWPRVRGRVDDFAALTLAHTARGIYVYTLGHW
jgi:hypothetical protein